MARVRPGRDGHRQLLLSWSSSLTGAGTAAGCRPGSRDREPTRIVPGAAGPVRRAAPGAPGAARRAGTAVDGRSPVPARQVGPGSPDPAGPAVMESRDLT